MADNVICADCSPSESKVDQSLAAIPDPAYNALLDPSTFSPPTSSLTPKVAIEFCDRVSTKHTIAHWRNDGLLLNVVSLV